VQAVLEGTVFWDEDRVRITAQLIDARDDTHLWSERYDRDLRDVLALHSEVAQEIVQGIKLQLTPAEAKCLAVRPKVDTEAHDACLRGWLRVASSTVKGQFDALDQLQRRQSAVAQRGDGRHDFGSTLGALARHHRFLIPRNSSCVASRSLISPQRR
jgi:hypothetical protein